MLRDDDKEKKEELTKKEEDKEAKRDRENALKKLNQITEQFNVASPIKLLNMWTWRWNAKRNRFEGSLAILSAIDEKIETRVSNEQLPQIQANLAEDIKNKLGGAKLEKVEFASTRGNVKTGLTYSTYSIVIDDAETIKELFTQSPEMMKSSQKMTSSSSESKKEEDKEAKRDRENAVKKLNQITEQFNVASPIKLLNMWTWRWNAKRNRFEGSLAILSAIDEKIEKKVSNEQLPQIQANLAEDIKNKLGGAKLEKVEFASTQSDSKKGLIYSTYSIVIDDAETIKELFNRLPPKLNEQPSEVSKPLPSELKEQPPKTTNNVDTLVAKDKFLTDFSEKAAHNKFDILGKKIGFFGTTPDNIREMRKVFAVYSQNKEQGKLTHDKIEEFYTTIVGIIEKIKPNEGRNPQVQDLYNDMKKEIQRIQEGKAWTFDRKNS